ncbi:hypothetical protein FOCC_FOCC011875 [Frankliniella occidentalis]|uniref:Uncharacterized protein LOC113210594 n=1 Tax=Frankliniella occidentalis TaxID=133901 RepID=A0A9C6X1I4_FRAOC|nr:uncharacterized protein LOC113210594 [Frankliniella occidentalis]XP_052127388.1 uncharacterized protein LOC113210594 [Frankliniella occidentalis]KAE8742581.1 hypothetical protein FOCC_FOCC011875 [Frankliniella occidentalis]
MSSTDDPTDCSLLPVKRRRSSILRRTSVAPAIINSEFAHRQYVLEAQQEAQEWIDLAKQRRQQAKIAEAALEQVSEHPPTLTFDNVEGDLTPEDLEFLAQRPDYEKISKASDNLFEKVALLKTKIENVHSQGKASEFLVKCRANSIASNICMYNDLAPVKQCTIP